MDSFSQLENKKKAVGKWILEAPVEIFLNEQFFRKMDVLVKEKKILYAKFAKKDILTDPTPYLKNSVLCIYTSKKVEPKPKELVVQFLGFEPLVWKSEKETMKDWEPGGELREQYD